MKIIFCLIEPYFSHVYSAIVALYFEILRKFHPDHLISRTRQDRKRLSKIKRLE